MGMTREEAIEYLTILGGIGGINDKEAMALEIAIEALEQEPRKGHWDIKDNMWWVCSACGCKTRMMKKYNVPNFCPACGADMRGEEE